MNEPALWDPRSAHQVHQDSYEVDGGEYGRWSTSRDVMSWRELRSPSDMDTIRPDDYGAQEQVNRERQAMLRYLEQHKQEPFYTHDDGGVAVLCGSLIWWVHRDVLHKCVYLWRLLMKSQRSKTGRAAGGATGTTDWVLELHNHCPLQLANVLSFLYFDAYDGANFDLRQPLYGDSLVKNTAMYIAGASVRHNSMMKFALRHIEAWAAAVAPLMYTVLDQPLQDYAVLRMADPLRRALAMVYEQPTSARSSELFPLRLALSRFVAAALPYLAANMAFRTQFRNEWDTGPLHAAEEPGGTAMEDAEASPEDGEKTIVDCISIDYAMFFGLELLQEHHALRVDQLKNPPKHEKQPEYRRVSSVPRLLRLLQRIARAEKYCTTAQLPPSRSLKTRSTTATGTATESSPTGSRPGSPVGTRPESPPKSPPESPQKKLPKSPPGTPANSPPLTPVSILSVDWSDDESEPSIPLWMDVDIGDTTEEEQDHSFWLLHRASAVFEHEQLMLQLLLEIDIALLGELESEPEPEPEEELDWF